VGPLARSVEDAALLYRALAGPDPGDPSTKGIEPPDDPLPRLREGVRGLRLAFPETVFFDDVDPEVEAAVRATEEVFRALGAAVRRIELPEVAEVWEEKNRPLFVAYEACEVNRELLDRDFERLDPNVARRMIGGRSLAASEFDVLNRRYAAYRERLHRTLDGVDALLLPASMVPARPLAPLLESPEAYRDYNLKLNRNAGLGNIFDLCGVSVPCGFTSNGLPIGLLVSARPFREDVALRAAYAYERATTWHERRPDLSWAEAPGRSSSTSPRAATP
jgi:aspartyl-tRNA(Asn)/glutamyl-tRNA(Gln) amidotransferase subunit A